jgi:hypothetical protein
MRGLFMLLFMVAFGIAQALLNLLAIVQFLWLLSGPQSTLAQLRAIVISGLADTARFLACATDEKPFPRKAWPDAGSLRQAKPRSILLLSAITSRFERQATCVQASHALATPATRCLR